MAQRLISMKKIAILIHDKVSLFEFGCAVELFALERPTIKNWYECDVVSFDEGLLDSCGNISIQAKKITTLLPYDMLIVPSWPVKDSQVSPHIKSEVLSLLNRKGVIISFCAGLFLLAEIGVLDGRKVTTHWCYADIVKTRYPSVEYVDDILYLFDGVIGCSAGSAASLDLGLEVIRQNYGYEVCNQVARRLVTSPHRDGGQSQFVEAPIDKRPNKFAETLDWAIDNLSTTLQVNDLANQANMSRRTFDRKFRAALNITPREWLSLQKLNLAKSLLESTNEPIESVAIKSGFDNAITLRNHFKKQLKISPGQYRKQFGYAKGS